MNYAKSLTSLRAFVPDKKYIIDIIKLCKLKHTENDWKIWADDYGNTLSVNRTREPSIILNQNINPQTIECKDLYAKAHIKKLASFNKFSLTAIKDNKIYVWLYDGNILRLCMYVDDILIENQPVLISGINNLKIIIDSILVEGWKELHSVMEPLGNEKADRAWISSWPIAGDLLILLPDIIKKDCNFV